MNDNPKWPREIWMREREDYDQGVVSAVLSEWATIARYEGDTERDADFHRYVDADIHESVNRYWVVRNEALAAERDALAEKLAMAVEAAADIENRTWLTSIGVVSKFRNDHPPGLAFKQLNEVMGALDTERRRALDHAAIKEGGV